MSSDWETSVEMSSVREDDGKTRVKMFRSSEDDEFRLGKMSQKIGRFHVKIELGKVRTIS